MGTAYLYEAQSVAAPHAALSMVALGIMTVVFSSIPPLARWVMGSVGA
jgi:putative effector of murein hydrolase